MDSLVDSLAELIEEEDAPLSGCECDYSVRRHRAGATDRAVWRAHARRWRCGHVRDQQAAAKQADLAVLTKEVRHRSRDSRSPRTAGRNATTTIETVRLSHVCLADGAAGQWFYARDGSTLQDLLDGELSEIAGTALQVRLRHQ